jgi:hypothetical protein
METSLAAPHRGEWDKRAALRSSIFVFAGQVQIDGLGDCPSQAHAEMDCCDAKKCPR